MIDWIIDLSMWLIDWLIRLKITISQTHWCKKMYTEISQVESLGERKEIFPFNSVKLLKYS